MIALTHAHSELTGREEVCTVCPTLVSEIDGKVIVDGTPDCDLLADHEFKFSRIHGPIPADLAEDDDTMIEHQARNKTLRMVARRQRQKLEKEEVKQARHRHVANIKANESRWNQVPDETEEVGIGDLNNPGVQRGLHRLFMDVFGPLMN